MPLKKVFVYGTPFALIAAVLLAPFIAEAILFADRFILPCMFNRVTHFYCPGCGCTRSVLALLHGDLLLSIKYNILPLSTCLLLIMLYAETAINVLAGISPRIIPRSARVWVSVGCAFGLYFIVRNIF